ncbi:helix-turn-helix domain-containing protein [Serratia sp. M24T3]|uniref:helix-turn-helix domain-containing protein n=1 Tax=Serratia sp. M24T3 TaxID=932213 RepID=UPI00025BA677|nr:right oriC-binding transcriptional activator [Serratia sp. M24T3]
MYHESIVSELLDWIEHNLDQSLTLDTIAAKSGYSKWHLQRLFKSFTGQTLGTYTRQRRLTMAATELRMTQNSVLRIADKYQFDSQQTFTRTFKKQFKTTPAVYRRLEQWPSFGLYPKIELDETHAEITAALGVTEKMSKSAEVTKAEASKVTVAKVGVMAGEEMEVKATVSGESELEWMGIKTAPSYNCQKTAWQNWKPCCDGAVSKTC